MRRAIQSLLFAATIAVVWSPVQASADGFFSPWTGANFSQSAGDGRAAFGVSAGAMGAGILGGEVDFGYSPNYFGTNSFVGSSNLLSLMGNVMIGVPVGGTSGPGVRPYVTVGAGLIRTDIDGVLEDSGLSDNRFGMNAGAGVMGYFNDHVGLKGEVRYFRNLKDNSAPNDFNIDFGGFHYWRAAVGLVLR
jgi:opacity protein-like surface antigen